MATHDARTLIKERGGITALHRALDSEARPVPKSTVQGWWDKNKIPWWRMEAVLAVPKADERSAA